MKVRTEKVIDVQEWDKLVSDTYGKVYSFQQQDGCRNKGIEYLTVPSKYDGDEYMHDEIPEIVNGPKEGIKFSKWLERDPKKPLKNENEDDRNEQWVIDLWWERNFYPCIETVANDLHKKGLLEAGEYMINIDW
jgi:hypothetical protein